MRAIWSGTVAFGLVSVPVKLYSATRSHDISLHQVHDEDGGRIRYQRRCEVCGKKIEYENIDKAYDDGEDTVIITDEDLHALPAREDKEIEVVQFVPDEQIDPMMFEKSYYLEPASKSSKAYILLRETLEDTARTAIVSFALRSRTRLAALRVRDDVIVLQTMMWADEVRAAEFDSTSATVKISQRERKMARSLVDQFSEDFEPDRFVDEYQDQLRILIDEKLEHGEAIDTSATFGEVDDEEAEGGDVIDLMEALKRSVDEKRKGSKPASRRGGTSQSSRSSGKSSSRSSGASEKSGTSKKSGTSRKSRASTASSRSQKSEKKTSKAKRTGAKSGSSKAKSPTSRSKSSKSAGSKASGAKASGSKSA